MNRLFGSTSGSIRFTISSSRGGAMLDVDFLNISSASGIVCRSVDSCDKVALDGPLELGLVRNLS